MQVPIPKAEGSEISVAEKLATLCCKVDPSIGVVSISRKYAKQQRLFENG
ncbi:hypothetical protein [Criibacterium bergeronii]|nr:hypothetical protein [Criibacterium bergeronii]